MYFIYDESSHIYVSARLLVSVSAEHCMFLRSISELSIPVLPRCLPTRSSIIRHTFMVWEVMSLKKYQEFCHGSQIGYQNKMIRAILNFHVSPIPPTKFRFNLTYGFGKDGLWRISRWLQW